MRTRSLVMSAAMAAVLGCGLTAPAIAQAPAEGPTLADALAGLPVASEDRTGYDRDLFHHWIDADHDGCATRQEVLIAEAVVAPTVDEDCKVSGGSWYSYYDEVTVEGPRGLDIDHLVPLAEARDSGARLRHRSSGSLPRPRPRRHRSEAPDRDNDPDNQPSQRVAEKIGLPFERNATSRSEKPVRIHATSL
nr:hypothetical protein [Glycomyces harbinensis]